MYRSVAFLIQTSQKIRVHLITKVSHLTHKIVQNIQIHLLLSVHRTITKPLFWRGLVPSAVDLETLISSPSRHLRIIFKCPLIAEEYVSEDPRQRCEKEGDKDGNCSLTQSKLDARSPAPPAPPRLVNMESGEAGPPALRPSN